MNAEILFDDGALKSLHHEKKFYTIGRSEKCDFAVRSDHSLSRLHATLYFNDSGCWQITDGDLLLGTCSLGGVQINGKKLDRNYGYELAHHDYVQLSPQTAFRFFLPLKQDSPNEADTIL